MRKVRAVSGWLGGGGKKHFPQTLREFANLLAASCREATQSHFNANRRDGGINLPINGLCGLIPSGFYSLGDFGVEPATGRLAVRESARRKNQFVAGERDRQSFIRRAGQRWQSVKRRIKRIERCVNRRLFRLSCRMPPRARNMQTSTFVHNRDRPFDEKQTAELSVTVYFFTCPVIPPPPGIRKRCISFCGIVSQQ